MKSNIKSNSDAIDMNLCDDNAIELNNWSHGEHAWLPPTNTLAPDNRRRAHELFCVPCLKHLMPSMLQEHINQDKHDRALAWWKTQKHRKDRKDEKPRSITIPPPSSMVQKFPTPPPSSRRSARSRSPLRKNTASSRMIHEQFRTVDLTTELHEEHDDDAKFTEDLPAFMSMNRPALELTDAVPTNFPGPPIFPPPPPPLQSMFYPEGHFETRAKSAAFVAPVADEELEWADWKPPDNQAPPVAHQREDMIQANRSRMIQLEIPRPPSPPRSLTMSTLQQEFPGATIIIVPPGGSFPFGNMQASMHSAQNPVQLGTTVIQVPNPWQNPQGQPIFHHPSMQYPWPSMFHPWR